jgi:SAM-dependent methyltransferase
MNRETLLAEIARRRPWYQHISFPEFGAATTDDPANAMIDAAWDNVIGGISVDEAARLRPTPKWNVLKDMLPDMSGRDVLEIGSNCGFFSLEFAKRGAKSVLGLDVAPHWLDNARFAAEVLGVRNVRFQLCDFMAFHPDKQEDGGGLLANADDTVPLPNDRYDIVFMSTVLDHLFFPLFAIYKMIRIAREYVLIDVPVYGGAEPTEPVAYLSTSPDFAHHGFVGTPAFFTSYIKRLGIAPDDVEALTYNEGRNVLYKIKTARKSAQLVGA